MVTRLTACSISRSVKAGRLAAGESGWRVLAVFERACDLATPEGDVVALVLPEIGDGPLNIVVEGQPGLFSAVQPGAAIRTGDAILRFDNLEITLEQATIWEPRPDWQRLRRNREEIEGRLPLVRDLALRQAPPDSLLAEQMPTSTYSATVRQAIQGLGAGWGGRWPADQCMEAAAAQLAGLGIGLTPAGDDFLVGVMLRAWLTHPAPEPFCQRLVQIAAPHTTTLSAALLRAAARGECSAAWHRLLAALQDAKESTLTRAVKGVLAHGHTSGADTLAGLLWLGQSQRAGSQHSFPAVDDNRLCQTDLRESPKGRTQFAPARCPLEF